MKSDQIPNQVKLPFSMAIGVVSQGIRIRFGRSVVTLLGVVSGIAFLMSMLSSQLLRRGVAGEEEARAESRRMAQVLQSETGPLTGKVVGIAIVSPPNTAEARLVAELQRRNPARLMIFGNQAADFQIADPPLERTTVLDFNQADVLVILGEATEAQKLLGQVNPPVTRPLLVFTRSMKEFKPIADLRAVEIAPVQTIESVARKAQAAARERARGIWITVISLVVTVIGISNAMLMSVTERFREIGTMKCLGALSSFVRTIFLVESVFMGIAGGIGGVLVGVIFSIGAYGATYGMPLVLAAASSNLGQLTWFMLLSLIAGVVLAVIAALYPARVASSMLPAVALRSNV